MKLELYYAPRTCALVPYVTLTEAGVNFQVHNMNSRSGQLKTPEYLRINPKHKVPVLVIDGDPLTENVAMNAWIADTFPAAKLMPSCDHTAVVEQGRRVVKSRVVNGVGIDVKEIWYVDGGVS